MRKFLFSIIFIIYLANFGYSQNDKLEGYWFEKEYVFWHNGSMEVLNISSERIAVINNDGLKFTKDSVEFFNDIFLCYLIYGQGERGYVEKKEYDINENLTPYKQDGDFIKIYRRCFRDWVKLEIVKLTADTLILRRKDNGELFIKKDISHNNDNISFKIHYYDDAIGEVIKPKIEINIDENGLINLKIIKDSTDIKAYDGKISIEYLNLFNNKFKLVDWNSLNGKNICCELDASGIHIDVTIANNKTINFRYDGVQKPLELYWFVNYLEILAYKFAYK